MMKMRQDNDVIDHTSLLYVEIETKLLWWIRQGIVYYETRQDNDVTDRTGAIYVEIRTKLS